MKKRFFSLLTPLGLSFFFSTSSIHAAFGLFDEYFRNHPNVRSIAATPGALLGAILPNLMLIAGLVFLFIIIYSGVELIHDSGTASSADITKHRSAIMWALMGLLIVVSAYFILQIVGGIIGFDFTNVPTL